MRESVIRLRDSPPFRQMIYLLSAACRCAATRVALDGFDTSLLRGRGRHMDKDNATGYSTTDYSSRQPFQEAVSRRRFLRAGGTAAGAAIAASAGTQLGGIARAARAAAATRPAQLTGTISDLKHVVILMQENR